MSTSVVAGTIAIIGALLGLLLNWVRGDTKEAKEVAWKTYHLVDDYRGEQRKIAATVEVLCKKTDKHERVLFGRDSLENNIDD